MHETYKQFDHAIHINLKTTSSSLSCFQSNFAAVVTNNIHISYQEPLFISIDERNSMVTPQEPTNLMQANKQQ